MDKSAFQSSPSHPALRESKFPHPGMTSSASQETRPRIGRDTLLLLALFAALIAGLATWYLRVAKNDAALSAEVQGLEQQAAKISEAVIEARTMQLHIRNTLNGVERVTGERQKEKWISALRGIGVSVGDQTEVRVVRFWRRPDGLPGKVLNIEGVVSGSASRAEADHFRGRLEVELKQRFEGVSQCRFSRIEDGTLPSPDGPSRTGTDFALEITFGEAIAAAAPRKQG